MEAGEQLYAAVKHLSHLPEVSLAARDVIARYADIVVDPHFDAFVQMSQSRPPLGDFVMIGRQRGTQGVRRLMRYGDLLDYVRDDIKPRLCWCTDGPHEAAEDADWWRPLTPDEDRTKGRHCQYIADVSAGRILRRPFAPTPPSPA